MIFTIAELLPAGELADIVGSLDPEDFVDGKLTAGWAAKKVKHNTQLSNKIAYGKDIKERIKKALLGHQKFQSAARPRIIHSMLISRYETGMSYGTHVDNAHMGGKDYLRSDLSFTYFLNAPSEYEGGELMIQEGECERAVKLPANSAIVYPSSTLHRVAPVASGVRLVLVGWVQSLLRNPSHREILYDLDQTRRSIFKANGQCPEFNWVSKSMANLLREWSDA